MISTSRSTLIRSAFLAACTNLAASRRPLFFSRHLKTVPNLPLMTIFNNSGRSAFGNLESFQWQLTMQLTIDSHIPADFFLHFEEIPHVETASNLDILRLERWLDLCQNKTCSSTDNKRRNQHPSFSSTTPLTSDRFAFVNNNHFLVLSFLFPFPLSLLSTLALLIMDFFWRVR